MDHQGWWSRPSRRRRAQGARRGAADELTLSTVDEFLAVLRLVLERSGLTAGQVAAKTSIARSSAYHLVSVSRTGLPVDPDQVLLFLTGCGLRMDQVGEIRPEPAPPRRGAEVRVDRCLEQLRLVRAAGDLDKAVAWARRLTSALLAEKAAEHVAAQPVSGG